MNTQPSDYRHWDDIVFEHRNQQYGAYTIRRAYAAFILRAMLMTLAFALLMLYYPKIHQWIYSKEPEAAILANTIQYTELALPPIIDRVIPPPTQAPPPVQKTTRFLPPRVTEQEVQEQDPMPTQEEVKQSTVGQETVAGTGDIIPAEPVPTESTGVAAPPADHIFNVVEQAASFNGGYEAMAKFLGKHLRYPAPARRIGVEGTVFVSFVIDKSGNISDVQVIKGIHADCDKEAIRVVSLMPPWIPGKQNNQPVKSRFVLPIKFKLG